MSLYFSGTNDSYIQISNNDLQINNGEFTIEWFQYRTDTHPFPRIFEFGKQSSMGVSIEGTTLVLRVNSSIILSTNIGDHKNQWVHIAVTRDANGRLRIIKNGTILKSKIYESAINNTETLYIGKIEDYANNSSSFGGYLTNFRYTKKGLYTADFSAPIAPLYNTSNTRILLLSHSETTMLSNYALHSTAITSENIGYNLSSPFSTNVLSLSTNTSQSFTGNKWNDFSSLKTEFTLENTTQQSDYLVFSRSKSARAVQSTETTRQLNNMTIYGWISVSHTTNNVNVLSILTNRFQGERIHGIHSLGKGGLRLRWNNTLSTINQDTNMNFPKNTWMFFALTIQRSNRKAKLYLKSPSINLSHEFPNRLAFDTSEFPINLSNLLIGCNYNVNGNPDRHFNGFMKTIQMFDAVLSETQIQEQYLLSGQQLGLLSLNIPDRYRILVVYNSSHRFEPEFVECVNQSVEILENIMLYTHGFRISAQPYNNTYDMVVEMNLEQLSPSTIGGASPMNYMINSNGLDIPIRQRIRINTRLYDTYIKDTDILNGIPVPAYVTTLIHEMLHGMGIAYITSEHPDDIGWDSYIDTSEAGQAWYLGPDPNDYTKSKAIMAYRKSTNNPFIKRIPIENSFGPGTRYSHWEEGLQESSTGSTIIEHRYFKYPEGSVFHPGIGLELMAGFSDKEQYLSRLTTGALEDYGYKVDNNSIYIMDFPSDKLQQPPSIIQNIRTVSGTWTAPQHVNSVEFFLIGGGGGGGGGSDTGGGGGGSAGLYRLGHRRVVENTTYSFVIGQGGAASTNTYPIIKETNGGDGGASSFGDIIALGGEGGLRSRQNKGSAGLKGTRQINHIHSVAGSGGANNLSSSGGSGGGGGGAIGDGTNGTPSSGGGGGDGIYIDWAGIKTTFGTGGKGARGNISTNGLSVPLNRGHGGNAGGAVSSTARIGSQGSSGILIVRYQRGILNENIINYPYLNTQPSANQLNELEKELEFFDSKTVDFVDFITERLQSTSFPTLKRVLKEYNNRLNTNKGIISGSLFSGLLPIDLSQKDLLTISSAPNQPTTITTSELNDLKAKTKLLYLMNEPNDVVQLRINNSIYNLTITNNGLRYNSTDYVLDDVFTLGDTNFTVRFTGSVGLEAEQVPDPEPDDEEQATNQETLPPIEDETPDIDDILPLIDEEQEEDGPILIIQEYSESIPVTPRPPMDTKLLSKKIVNNPANRSLFSLLNYATNRILPENNFLSMNASNSDRLRKLKIENHINANHR